MPPAEVAIHPSGGPDAHELFLMCDDIKATIAELTAKGVEHTPLKMPGGGDLGLYEPRHPTA